MGFLDHKVEIELSLSPKLSAQVDQLIKCLCNRIVGVGPVFTPPVVRPEESSMPSIKLLKKSAALKTLAKAKRGDTVPNYGLQDNEDGSFTIFGMDAGGNSGIDISAIATMTVSVDNPAVFSVDAPNGMTDVCHGLTPGVATVTAIVTWNDGSVGPFTVTFTGTVALGPAVGVGPPVFGPPTIR